MSDMACSNNVSSPLCTGESPRWLTAMLDFRLHPLMIPYFCSSRISCNGNLQSFPDFVLGTSSTEGCFLPEVLLMYSLHGLYPAVHTASKMMPPGGHETKAMQHIFGQLLRQYCPSCMFYLEPVIRTESHLTITVRVG